MVASWPVDAGDWHKRGVSIERLVSCVVERAKPGHIIFRHDGGSDRSKTVQTLPEMIDQLTQIGYEFVTVPDMLHISRPGTH